MVNKFVSIGFGAIYILVGLLGFTVSGDSGFASTDGGLLLGIFEVNPLHNIVHLLVGALLIAGGMAGPKIAKNVNTAVGGVYLFVGVLGLLLLGSAANILALNPMDNVLHLASGTLLMAVALAGDRSRVVTAR